MQRRALPPPPRTEQGSKNQSDGVSVAPPQAIKRPTRPLPPHPSISVESTGEQYESVDILAPTPQVPEQTYDDFDQQVYPPASPKQTTYDDFEVQQPRHPLPGSSAVNNGPKSLPITKSKQDWPAPSSPEEVYDDMDEVDPVPVRPTAKRDPLPPPPAASEEVYDDMDEVDPVPVRPTAKRDPLPPPPAASEEVYDDMDEVDPVPVRPTAKRDPLPPPPAASEETYDEFEEVGPQRKVPQIPISKPSAISLREQFEEEDSMYDEVTLKPDVGSVAKVAKPQILPRTLTESTDVDRGQEDEIYEECDENDSPVTSRSQDKRARVQSPKSEIYDAPEDGEEIYEDPGEEDEERGADLHFVPPPPPLPSSLGGEGQSSNTTSLLSHSAEAFDDHNIYQIEEEEDSPLPPPLPNRPQAPKVEDPPIPSLPQRPAVGIKKTIAKQPMAAAGLDLSQILNIKLKKVANPPVATKAMPSAVSKDADSHLVNWAAGLRKTSDSREDNINRVIQPLQPPAHKLKKTVTGNDDSSPLKVEISKPVVKPKKADRPVRLPRNTPQTEPFVPISVQVSPAIDVKGTPAPRQNSVPEVDVPVVRSSKDQPLPNPPPTAIVRPERHVDNNSNEVTVSTTRSLPAVPPADDTQEQEQDMLLPYGWYHGSIDRLETEQRLRSVDGDGVFLVRKSKQGAESQPYTMAILYKGNIFTLKIRCRDKDKKIALGEEKNGEMTFSSVPSLVSYHRDHNVILIGNPSGETMLSDYPRRV